MYVCMHVPPSLYPLLLSLFYFILYIYISFLDLLSISFFFLFLCFLCGIFILDFHCHFISFHFCYIYHDMTCRGRLVMMMKSYLLIE
ncbi:uncharacterized protein GGS25DRAFT_363154 [Hypoxylon fragiforme]|uniref:uncharacterized protein n=1 Tax=Hypoxylon fragiforme TaxID=63214 RepID=UPI0020C6742C|nr:uncharacterized protein GGS25DRAFT_363154 [Hypoxylon fragiforme]KAI2605929.1 hypothetical protein GGS25DRAFT_363154 [Hypoxylon fragiforme]